MHNLEYMKFSFKPVNKADMPAFTDKADQLINLCLNETNTVADLVYTRHRNSVSVTIIPNDWGALFNGSKLVMRNFSTLWHNLYQFAVDETGKLFSLEIGADGKQRHVTGRDWDKLKMKMGLEEYKEISLSESQTVVESENKPREKPEATQPSTGDAKMPNQLSVLSFRIRNCSHGRDKVYKHNLAQSLKTLFPNEDFKVLRDIVTEYKLTLDKQLSREEIGRIINAHKATAAETNVEFGPVLVDDAYIHRKKMEDYC